MIIAATEGEVILSPYQLRADLEVDILKAALHDRRELARLPDVGDVAGEQSPGRGPVRLVVVVDLAELARVSGSRRREHATRGHNRHRKADRTPSGRG